MGGPAASAPVTDPTAAYASATPSSKGGMNAPQTPQMQTGSDYNPSNVLPNMTPFTLPPSVGPVTGALPQQPAQANDGSFGTPNWYANLVSGAGMNDIFNYTMPG